MKSIHAAGVASLLIATVTMAAPAAESQFPTRPIRLLVPQAAGGSNDIMARNVANHLTQTFGKQVVVDNRPGAEGIIGTEIVARSAPDGYTLLLASAAFTMNPAVRKLPYDSLAAFDWVAKLGSGPTVLTVGPLLPVGTVKEILASGKRSRVSSRWPARAVFSISAPRCFAASPVSILRSCCTKAASLR